MGNNRACIIKGLAIFVWLLVFILGALMITGLINTRLQVKGQGLRVLRADEDTELFSRQTELARLDAFPGMVYRSISEDAAVEDYEWRIYTLKLENTGLVSADRVEFSVYPQRDDVLMYPLKDAASIAPRSSEEMSFVILTRRGGEDERDIRVTYYLWGNPCSIRCVYR